MTFLPPGLLPVVFAAVLEPKWAAVAAIGVVLVVIIAWKFLKLAFKIGLVVAAAVALFLLLRWSGVL